MYKLYQITNTVNGKIYVGITKLLLQQRWAKHLKDSLDPKYPLHWAIKKYGPGSFRLDLLCESNDRKEIGMLEEDTIVATGSRITENGYNVAKGGYGGDLGPEVNARRKQTMLNRTPAEKARLSLIYSASQTGSTRSDESKQKMSQLQKERGGYGPATHSEDTKVKMSLASKGKAKSQKTRLAMSASAIINNNGTRFNGRRASCLCCHKEWDIGNYTLHIRKMYEL